MPFTSAYSKWCDRYSNIQYNYGLITKMKLKIGQMWIPSVWELWDLNFYRNVPYRKDVELLPAYLFNWYNMGKRDWLQWRHYFNEIFYSRLPFSIGWALSLSIAFFIIHLKNVMGLDSKSLFADGFAAMTGGIVLLMLIMCCWWIWCWFNDLLYESVVDSRYIKKLRAAFVCGFFLFLLSEIMLFGGFFWAYFDRVYNPGYVTSVCVPSGMECIDYKRWPLVGTIVLVTSGYYANNAYYLVKAGIYDNFVWFAWCTLILAVLFLSIQLVEYNGLSFTISDNVYGSFFYLLTGFHGFHVTVGFLFLCEQYGRVISSSSSLSDYMNDMHYFSDASMIFNRDRHLGLAFSLIYWHFVDIIWIFLFINVYVYNNDSQWDNFSIDMYIYCTSSDYRSTYLRASDINVLIVQNSFAEYTPWVRNWIFYRSI
jgi:heme/copper-type cytochrome/quinol oxidase subunit 3